jgi:hypothetical protein
MYLGLLTIRAAVKDAFIIGCGCPIGLAVGFVVVDGMRVSCNTGPTGLAEEDRFLLEINLDELDNSTGEDQTYWLLSLQAARDARQLLLQQNNIATRDTQGQSGT